MKTLKDTLNIISETGSLINATIIMNDNEMNVTARITNINNEGMKKGMFVYELNIDDPCTHERVYSHEETRGTITKTLHCFLMNQLDELEKILDNEGICKHEGSDSDIDIPCFEKIVPDFIITDYPEKVLQFTVALKMMAVKYTEDKMNMDELFFTYQNFDTMIKFLGDRKVSFTYDNKNKSVKLTDGWSFDIIRYGKNDKLLKFYKTEYGLKIKDNRQ